MNRLKFRSVVLAACLLLPSGSVLAQLGDGNQSGLPPFAAFHGSGLDIVNVNNGKLHIDIPLREVSQRHGSITYRFLYDPPSYTLSAYLDNHSVFYETTVDDFQVGEPTGGFRFVDPMSSWYLIWESKSVICSAPGLAPAGLSPVMWDTGVGTNFALIDPDGTQHPVNLQYASPGGSSLSLLKGHTTDGSGILVDISGSTGGFT